MLFPLNSGKADDVRSSSLSSAASSASSISSSVAASATTDSSASTSSSSSTASAEKPSRSEVQEQVAKDLRTWQEKFAKAADKGAEDLEERVKELPTIRSKAKPRASAKLSLSSLKRLWSRNSRTLSRKS